MTKPETHLQPSEIGGVLREARVGLGMEPEQAAESSGLDRSTLETLERHDPLDWGTDTRVLAALRVYGRFLELDPEPIVTAAWRSARQGYRRPRPTAVEPLIPASAYRHGGRRRRRWVLAGVMAFSVVLAGAAVLFAFDVPDQVLTTFFDSSPPAPAGPTSPEPTAPQEPAAQLEEPRDEAGREEAEPDEASRDEGDAPEDEEGTAQAEEALPGRPPEETPVQVLDALGDEETTAQVTQYLEELGYEIALVDTTIRLWEDTAVYFNDGWETEAESLQARDDRFPVGGPNEAFVDEAGLHVVVGLDWTD